MAVVKDFLEKEMHTRVRFLSKRLCARYRRHKSRQTPVPGQGNLPVYELKAELQADP